MIVMDWARLVVGALTLLLATVAIALSLRIYARLLATVRAGFGKVRVELLGVPDFMVAAVLIAWLGSSALHGFLRHTPEAPLTDTALRESAALFGAVIGAIGLFLHGRRISVVRLFGLNPTDPGSVLKRGAGLFVAALPLVFLCFGLVQAVVHQEMEMQEIAKYFQDAARNSDWKRILLAAGMAGVIAPVTEEFLFRGYFYGVLRRYLGVLPAMLLVSALFAAIHMNGPVFLPLFVLAICFTLAYEATGSLLAPMLMHALFNSAMLAAMFYSAHHS
ncbi:MAG: CPBP family intramembrane metalloprotease [Verrucomicrobia bacterium]|nr:CPBP family intramembrane metalloprotease [Verrucomicrobiota bacterium]